MLFSSITFLYYYLPLVILIYYIVPSRFKNLVLFSSSLIFYGWGEPKFVVIMILAIIAGYIFGRLIEFYQNTKLAKAFLILSIITSIGILGYFKYTDFFIANVNAIFKTSIPLLHIVLPIGVSFYLFQIMSYTIDVYRKTVSSQKSFVNFGAYVSSFPQLIAGPIVRYTDIAKQLEYREHSFDKTALGIERFVMGLSKKVLLANTLGELCNIFVASGDKSVLFYWLYAISFTLHIYFDFSGYSDMAIGLGKIFGFDFIENFNYPYISKTVTDFWRRWHISLGSWFRDYVYIPLGGNRVSKSRWLFNILVVWFLTGFWHGASWNFIIWGLYFALFLIIEKLFFKKYLENFKFISHIYLLLIVIIGFVIFNAPNMSEALTYIASMFNLTDAPMISNEFIYYFKSYALVIVMAIFFATPLAKQLYNKLLNSKFENLVRIIAIVIMIILLLMTTAYLVDGSFNPFLYFRF